MTEGGHFYVLEWKDILILRADVEERNKLKERDGNLTMDAHFKHPGMEDLPWEPMERGQENWEKGIVSLKRTGWEEVQSK